MNNISNKLTKPVLIIVLSFFCSTPLLAQQKKNNLSIHTTTHHFIPSKPYLGETSYLPWGLLGLKYQYQIGHHIAAYANYTFTPNLFHLHSGVGFFSWADTKNMNHQMKINKGAYFNPEGQLWKRVCYNFFDIGASYYYSINQKQRLTANLALSYVYALNRYVTSAYSGQGELLIKEMEERWDYCWGSVAGLSYDYYFWQGCVNAGVAVNFRYYGKNIPFFMDYGLHVGYNF